MCRMYACEHKKWKKLKTLQFMIFKKYLETFSNKASISTTSNQGPPPLSRLSLSLLYMYNCTCTQLWCFWFTEASPETYLGCYREYGAEAVFVIPSSNTFNGSTPDGCREGCRKDLIYSFAGLWVRICLSIQWRNYMYVGGARRQTLPRCPPSLGTSIQFF